MPRRQPLYCRRCAEESGAPHRERDAADAARFVGQFDRRARRRRLPAAASAVPDDADTHEPAVVSRTHQPRTIGRAPRRTRTRRRVCTERPEFLIYGVTQNKPDYFRFCSPHSVFLFWPSVLWPSVL